MKQNQPSFTDNFKVAFKELLNGKEAIEDTATLKPQDTESDVKIHTDIPADVPVVDEPATESKLSFELFSDKVKVSPTPVFEQPKIAPIPTLISKDVEIKGDIKTAGDIEIFGTVCGNIVSEGQVTVAGSVSGNIKADTITVCAGTVSAQTIDCAGKLIIKKGSTVHADITASSADVNAVVVGNLTVSSDCAFGESCNIKGDITTKSISIGMGAALSGMLSVGQKG